MAIVRTALYLIAVLTLAFLAFAAWFAAAWGFDPLWLFPLDALGLIIAGGLTFYARSLGRKFSRLKDAKAREETT